MNIIISLIGCIAVVVLIYLVRILWRSDQL